MRRIKYACLEQTLHFSLREPMPPEDTSRIIRTEYEQYKLDLEHKGIRYKIADEAFQPDGSLIIKVKKQYNAHDCGNYLD